MAKKDYTGRFAYGADLFLMNIKNYIIVFANQRTALFLQEM